MNVGGEWDFLFLMKVKPVVFLMLMDDPADTARDRGGGAVNRTARTVRPKPAEREQGAQVTRVGRGSP